MANNYNIKVNATLNTKGIQEALKGVESKYGNIKIGTGAASGIKSIGTAAKESKGMLGEFNAQLKKLPETIPKVAAFKVATTAINAFQDACVDAVQQVFELDEALTEFKKVSDLSGDALDEYADKLGNLGETVARTKSEMVEAATEFVKSGYSEDESANLAQVASLYQNIADEEISAGESASFIIAQMKAFNVTAEDSIHIVDAVNEVSNNFAVSSADLATNLGKVSSTLSITGTSFEESLGMLTAITEITRNASMASRGLKMISSRLTQVLDDSSATGKKLTEIYDGLGIALKDEEGQIRSTFDILQDLSKQWGGLSKNEQEYIALQSAGANQVKF